LIYTVASKLDEFAYFVIVDEGQRADISSSYYQLRTLGGDWTPPALKTAQSRKPLGDYPGFGSINLPVVSRRLLDALTPLLSGQREVLPLGVFKRVEYFVLNVLDAVDAIDQNQSIYGPSEHLPRGALREAVYKPGALEGRHLFRLVLSEPGAHPSYSGVLASEEFRRAVEQHNLLGINFEPFGTVRTPTPKPPVDGGVDFDEPSYRSKLPAAYRDLLASYPKELAATAGEWELLANLEDAIELNRKMRRLWPHSDYRKRPIADSYFLIGQDGGGDLYAIDLALGNSTPVLEFDHERAKWRPRAASLSDFVKQLKDLKD
jgi:hypothetical protein